MLAVGGLKGAAKRTAFGDVSNTAKTLSSSRDDSAITGKSGQIILKPVAPQENVAAFLRPAQRSLNIAIPKAPVHVQLIPTSLESISKPPQQAQHVQQHKRALSKPSTTIYKDSSAIDPPSQPAVQGNEPVLTVPAHQSLAPRHYKSQPYLKSGQPVPPFVQSKPVMVEPLADAVPSDPTYEDAPEEPLAQSPKNSYEAYMKLMEGNLNDLGPEVSKGHQDVAERVNKPLPAPPVASEPEEYWEEEEEEEIYDEQGYTTAHSYRSRGDNTTGGATTVLLPKVTNKVKKELAEAKELVESSRTPEEIDDEAWDTSMVAEYGEEIFAYMRELEVSLPGSTLYLVF
jgi:G2/mitotic-specific cyclin 3/4